MEVSIKTNGVELFNRFIANAEGSLWDRQDRYRERVAMATLLQFAGKLIRFEVRKHKNIRTELGVVLKIESIGRFTKETTKTLATYEGRFLVQTKKGVTLVERRLLKSVNGDISHFRNRSPRFFPYDPFFFYTDFDIDKSNHDGLLIVV